MKTVLAALTMVMFMAASVGPALAQGPATGSEDQRVMQMTQMMEQMKEQMKQMHEQMSGMMQEHRAQMQKGCPGAAAPDSTKKGG